MEAKTGRSFGLGKAASALVLAALLTTPSTFAQSEEEFQTWRVTLTNLTPGMIVAPPLFITHNLKVRLFQVGKPASDFVSLIAEDAFTDPLIEFLEASPDALDVALAPTPLQPGKSVTIEMRTSREFPRFTYIGMLAPTNDGFMALQSHVLHGGPWRQYAHVPVYDGGTERNSEACEFIAAENPCGNRFQRDPAPAEGFIHIHPGIRGIADLDPLVFTWQNPTVEIVMTRVPSN